MDRVSYEDSEEMPDVMNNSFYIFHKIRGIYTALKAEGKKSYARDRVRWGNTDLHKSSILVPERMHLVQNKLHSMAHLWCMYS